MSDGSGSESSSGPETADKAKNATCALYDDDVLSMTPSEIDRQLEEEMQRQLAEEATKMQNGGSDLQILDEDPGDYARNKEFDQSATSFKSMVSHATVLT